MLIMVILSISLLPLNGAVEDCLGYLELHPEIVAPLAMDLCGCFSMLIQSCVYIFSDLLNIYLPCCILFSPIIEFFTGLLLELSSNFLYCLCALITGASILDTTLELCCSTTIFLSSSSCYCIPAYISIMTSLIGTCIAWNGAMMSSINPIFGSALCLIGFLMTTAGIIIACSCNTLVDIALEFVARDVIDIIFGEFGMGTLNFLFENLENLINSLESNCLGAMMRAFRALFLIILQTLTILNIMSLSFCCLCHPTMCILGVSSSILLSIFILCSELISMQLLLSISFLLSYLLRFLSAVLMDITSSLLDFNGYTITEEPITF